MQASDGPVGAPVVLIDDLAVSDNPAVVSLWEESELTRPWNDPELDIRRALAGSSSTVLTARDGTVLAGTVMVGHDGHRGWVYYLAVVSSPLTWRCTPPYVCTPNNGCVPAAR